MAYTKLHVHIPVTAFAAVLKINFWVWCSAGPEVFKFTGPTAKLLATLIIFNFFFGCMPFVSASCNQINATIEFIYPYIAAKTSVLQYDFAVRLQYRCMYIKCSSTIIIAI